MYQIKTCDLCGAKGVFVDVRKGQPNKCIPCIAKEQREERK